MTRIADVIHGWLGWCPNVRAVPRVTVVQGAGPVATVPGGGPGIPWGGWMDRYRNRVLFQAVFYTFAFAAFLPFFSGTGVIRPALVVGILAGMAVFALSAGRLWNTFDLALTGGKERGSGRVGYAILFLVAGIILAGAALILLAGFSLIPLETALVLPAVATGFALIPWYLLGLILTWERMRASVLLFDRRSQSFTAEGFGH